MDTETCPGCGTKKGDLHMDNCHLEHCPVCDKQPRTCNCMHSEKCPICGKQHGACECVIPPRIPFGT